MSYPVRLEAKLTKQMPIKDKCVNSPLVRYPISFAHPIGRVIGVEFAVTQNQSLIIPFWGKATLNFGLCWYEIFKAREDPMDVFCYDDPCFE